MGREMGWKCWRVREWIECVYTRSDGAELDRCR
jgi:hypothetical protein